MTTTYRKTATIEATQWFKMGDHPAVVMKSDPNRYADEGIPWCPTMEGGHVVTPGDWIATGIRGEHWPINPDVFAETYTQVDAALSTPATEPQPAADTRVTDAMIVKIWELAQQYDDDAEFMGLVHAIIDNASPAPSDKIAEAAIDRCMEEIDDIICEADVSYPAGRDAGTSIDFDRDAVLAALRALAGKGE